MTTSIEKYDKKQLATLDPSRLSQAVDGYVKGLFTALEETGKALDAAMRMKREYAGGDIREEKILQAAVASARRYSAEAAERINAYVEEQRALFKSKGCQPDMAYRWAIIPVGETLANGAERCRMVKRGTTFEACDISDDEDRSVRATIRTPSESVGVSKDMMRGKYRDAGMLIDEAVCGIDKSEMFGTD